MFQVKITGWIFHGVWVVRVELLREIVYKSAIFIYFGIQKTFYCWMNICSKIRKRSFVFLAVFMFKKNPKKPPFLWATDEETPLKIFMYESRSYIWRLWKPRNNKFRLYPFKIIFLAPSRPQKCKKKSIFLNNKVEDPLKRIYGK